MSLHRGAPSGRPRFAAPGLLAVLVFTIAGCTPAKRGLTPEEIEKWPRVQDEGVTIRIKEGDVDPFAAKLVARAIAVVHSQVTHELGLWKQGEQRPPYAEVLLYRDAGWGQERWLVTHAVIIERPLRVQIPCALPEDDKDGEAIAARIRGTIAHEVAEATVLTRVPILDPYLRWMHDGIAESVEYRVLRRLDPRAADETLNRYEQYAREARRAGISWVDLTRWRQLPDWIIHSDALLREGPLYLDDLPSSLKRLASKRVSFQEKDPEQVSVLDVLLDMLGESWAREQLPFGAGECDPRPRPGQFLCYDASFCFWLELERAHPGLTAAVLARIAAWKEPVLRSDDVVKMLNALTGQDVTARLERFSLDRLESILAAERKR
ncbi:MAG: hypothetical protein ACAI25_16285 [Planctomycetota bacterium]